MNNWQIEYTDQVEGKYAYGREALLSLGNGFLGWRGAPIWTRANQDHYPGLYAAGVFNQTTTPVDGMDVKNEDLVNLPNPQLLDVVVNGQALAELPVATQNERLNLASGVLHADYTFMHPAGTVTLRVERWIDPIRWHHLGWTATLITDFDAEMTLTSVVDAAIENQNVARYQKFDSREFDVVTVDPTDRYVEVATRTTDITIGLMVNTNVAVNGAKTSVSVAATATELRESTEVTVAAGDVVTLTKQIGVATSQETDGDLATFLAKEFTEVPVTHLAKHAEKYWAAVWADQDIQIETDDDLNQRLVRLNVFHLNQAANWRANQHLDASVGARGLTGEGYRGHIFWDELFMMPYYAAHEPKTARALLQYRLNRLAAAQANAAREGEQGALYPWQSGLIGDEQSQLIHLNTVSGEFEPDNSRLQRHISLAVVYNLWVYVKMTGDLSILAEGGLATLFETSRFWLGKVTLNEHGRYDLSGVMGPDEYHEEYPGAEGGGLTNNAYTNVMLSWALGWLFELQTTCSEFAEVAAAHELDAVWFARAEAVMKQLCIEQDDDGVVAQFAGYFDLAELDLDAYTEKYGDIHRIDRILKAEGQSPDAYQVGKQPDFLMLGYNFTPQYMETLAAKMGQPLQPDWLRQNYDYYLARTVHGSTISRPVFAKLALSLGELATAETFLAEALQSDYADIQGGTTAEGLHMAVMGETIAVIVNGFGGVNLTEGRVRLDPVLPPNWQRVAFKQRYHGVTLAVQVTPDTVEVVADDALELTIKGQLIALLPNVAMTLPLTN